MCTKYFIPKDFLQLTNTPTRGSGKSGCFFSENFPFVQLHHLYLCKNFTKSTAHKTLSKRIVFPAVQNVFYCNCIVSCTEVKMDAEVIGWLTSSISQVLQYYTVFMWSHYVVKDWFVLIKGTEVYFGLFRIKI